MKWIKCADRLPKANHIDTYHCNIRMKDMDESTFPEGVTFSGEWEISDNYEVVEWLDESNESPQPFPGIEQRAKELFPAEAFHGHIPKRQKAIQLAIEFIAHINYLYEKKDAELAEARKEIKDLKDSAKGYRDSFDQ